MSDSSAYVNAISGLIARYSEFLKSTMELHKKILEPPYVTRKEFARIAEDLSMIKAMLKKKPDEPPCGNKKKMTTKEKKEKK